MLATKAICAARRYYFSLINGTLLYKKTRWVLTLMFVLLYIERVKGLSYDVITYLIFFYILQLIISYFTPKGLMEDENQYNDYTQDQETLMFNEIETEADKPLVRSMNELQMWERITFVFLMGIVCTFFKAFEIDVFWPVLMLYSGVLFCYTIHKIVTKMQKYRYNFKDFSKKPLIS